MSGSETTTARRKEVWDAVKNAVHAYGCNPCQATEQEVETAVRDLRAYASHEAAARFPAHTVPKATQRER